MNIKNINWKQPKYVLPAILYPLLLGCGYFIIDIFDTDLAETPTNMQTTEYLNPNLPQAQINNDGIGGKYDNMQKSFGRIQDFSAVENIDRDADQGQTEDYDSKYTQEDIALLDADAAQRTAEMENASGMQERLRKSAEKGKEMMIDSIGVNLSETDRLARNKQREQEAMNELNKALAEARLKGQKGLDTVNDATTPPTTPPTSLTGKIEINDKAVSALQDDTKSQAVVKKVKTTSDYFNTLTENEKEPHLIKAIIDENIKAVDGSRVRLRLLDDVEINETIVKKGSYIYAIMSGFGSQRVKGNVNSLMVGDELVKVSLSLYDTDGLEGLYVPSSSFRETSKDVASSAMNGTMSMNNGNESNNFAQWGMQAVQNAYTRTSNAISKAIKKNSVKLKYGSFVYLVNGREKKDK
ncbi:conjugative transposon protein TraM [Parabacteroides leei]|uniref:conjugative transposon protein TraM n=1 Tax=Parabacteroides leei TaxID=2939491 RepID=UPI0018971209|nr:conjugative transposon protein TraM [Parabacteroides goldsteinii]